MSSEGDAGSRRTRGVGNKQAREGKSPATQSTPEINIEQPPSKPFTTSPRVKSPTPHPPSGTSSPNPRKSKGGELSPGGPRPRANSTGSSSAPKNEDNDVLSRIMRGVRYLSHDDSELNVSFKHVFVSAKTPKEGDMKPDSARFFKQGAANSLEAPKEDDTIAGGGSIPKPNTSKPPARRGQAHRGTSNTRDNTGNKARDGAKGGKPGGPGKGVRKVASQDNLVVPGQKDGSKPDKGRASSVPRQRQQRGPPLFDVQKGGENRHKRLLADRWFQNLESLTERLVASYSTSEYERVKIAVLDTGVEKNLRRNTPEIIRQHGKQIKGKTFVSEGSEDTPWIKDTNGHGTHVTGLLLRVAPRAEIFVARILKGWENTIDPKNVEEALKCCIDEWNVDIITMSFGFDKLHAGIEDQLNRALAKRILVFAAASNDGASKANNIAWPARERTVFCIFSATGEGSKSSFNPPLQPGLNFATLGEEVESDWPVPLLTDAEKEEGVTTMRKSGTSFATPIAAGIAALVLEFARQPPLSGTPEVARQLKKMDIMEDVFKAMSEQTASRFNYIYPWKAFNAQESQGTSEGEGGKDHNDAEADFSARKVVAVQLIQLVGRHANIF